MNETGILILSLIGLNIPFWIVFVVIVRYLISVFKLIHQVKTAEPDLWIALGRPTMFPMLHASLNPFTELFSQMRFLVWFLKGGKGAQTTETKAMVESTKRLFGIAMIGVVSILVLSIIEFWLIRTMIVTTGNG